MDAVRNHQACSYPPLLFLRVLRLLLAAARPLSADIAVVALPAELQSDGESEKWGERVSIGFRRRRRSAAGKQAANGLQVPRTTTAGPDDFSSSRLPLASTTPSRIRPPPRMTYHRRHTSLRKDERRSEQGEEDVPVRGHYETVSQAPVSTTRDKDDKSDDDNYL
jgi:hypothetical protein